LWLYGQRVSFLHVRRPKTKSKADPFVEPNDNVKNISLSFPVHLVSLCITLGKIHAQQTPTRFRPGFGFDEVDEKFEEVDES
jgi:hypothetical protein